MQTANRDDIFLDKIIATKFSASFMNNSKWVKLITTFVDNSAEIKECRVKLIWDDKDNGRLLLINEDVQYGLDFYDNAMEAMISGNPKGWYAYKEIQWLDFPAIVQIKAGDGTAKQRLEKIKAIIDGLGVFQTELSEDNLRIYAYK